jgi:hypothetical protein
MLGRLKDEVLRRIKLTAKPTSISGFVEEYWPITSVSQFGPCPLLAEPYIAICRLLLVVDHGASGGPW